MPRNLSTSMEGLIGSSSAHHIKGFHPRANLSPCKQPEFDVRPHLVKCLDQRSPHHHSGLAINAPHLHVMSQDRSLVQKQLAEMLPVRRSFCQQLYFHCSTDSHFHIFEYHGVLILHHEGSGKRSVQAGSRCGDRENQVRKMGFLTTG